MSELTRCNYCDMKMIKAKAKKDGARVYTRPSDFCLGGFNVYVVPKGETLDTTDPDDGGKHWVAWMMSIPDTCCC